MTATHRRIAQPIFEESPPTPIRIERRPSTQLQDDDPLLITAASTPNHRPTSLKRRISEWVSVLVFAVVCSFICSLRARPVVQPPMDPRDLLVRALPSDSAVFDLYNDFEPRLNGQQLTSRLSAYPSTTAGQHVSALLNGDCARSNLFPLMEALAIHTQASAPVLVNPINMSVLFSGDETTRRTILVTEADQMTIEQMRSMESLLDWKPNRTPSAVILCGKWSDPGANLRELLLHKYKRPALLGRLHLVKDIPDSSETTIS